MNSKHLLFWLTFGSIVTLFELFLFILICGTIENFTFHKQYCLFLLPNLIYLGAQVIINYGILTEDFDNKK